MKKYLTPLATALLVAGATLPGWGQDAPASAAASALAATAKNNLQVFFSSPEIVLPNLYTAAIAHSADITRLEAATGVAEADVKLASKRILNALALTGSYNYGTLPYFATAESATGATSPIYQVNPFNLGARAQFSTGINLVLPLDALVSRRTTLDRQQLVVDQTVAQRRSQEVTIRQQVITQYQTLNLTRITQQNAWDMLQSAGINRQIADRRFKQGEIQVDEQMMSMDFYGRAQLTYEEAHNRYQTAQLLLEEMIGLPITANALVAKAE
ncbi:MAG: TolC family protein [Janthinobacterium lividum]